MKNYLLYTAFVVLLFLTSVLMAQDKKAHNVDNTGIALQGYSRYLTLTLV